MDTYHYTFDVDKHLPKNITCKVGVAGSGNVEIIVRPNNNVLQIKFYINTYISGFESTWQAVIQRFVEDYPYGGLSYTLNDAGATAPVVALRLRQAIETYKVGYRHTENYIEASARRRIYSLVDKDSFHEILLEDDSTSPNLPYLNIQVESDDGVVIGLATLDHKKIVIAAQEKNFIGGSVGEVHGAKIIGSIKYAIKNHYDAIILLIDSGGVRLHEANVGEIEISEITRALLDAKSAGILTIGVICGSNGAFGGMGIISGVLDHLIVSRIARIGVSGASVIQTVKGRETFDSNDHALIWRVYGARTRLMQGAVDSYTTNNIDEIRKVLIKALHYRKPGELLTEELLTQENKRLTHRQQMAGDCQEQGQWLEKNKPKLAKANLYNLDDKSFITLFNHSDLGEGNAEE